LQDLLLTPKSLRLEAKQFKSPPGEAVIRLRSSAAFVRTVRLIHAYGARLEYEEFDVPDRTGAQVASLSVFLNF